MNSMKVHLNRTINPSPPPFTPPISETAPPTRSVFFFSETACQFLPPLRCSALGAWVLWFRAKRYFIQNWAFKDVIFDPPKKIKIDTKTYGLEKR